MITVTQVQQDMMAIKRRAEEARPDGGAVTPAHAAEQAATSGQRAADRPQVPSVSEQEWAGLSPADRARLEQAGIVFDSQNGVMADAQSGTQVSWAEARSVLDRPCVGKGYDDRGATLGPGEGMQPGQIEPQDFRRGYIDQGHASRSPLAEPPRMAPLPPEGRGILQPIELSAAPVVSGTGPAMQGIAAHQARSAATAGRPPIPRGSA